VTDLITRVASAAETLAEMVDRIPDEVPAILKMNVSDPGRFADLAATNMNFRILRQGRSAASGSTSANGCVSSSAGWNARSRARA